MTMSAVKCGLAAVLAVGGLFAGGASAQAQEYIPYPYAVPVAVPQVVVTTPVYAPTLVYRAPVYRAPVYAPAVVVRPRPLLGAVTYPIRAAVAYRPRLVVW
jgi:hypothetical protein